jgi:hypothetical protein
MSRFTNEQTVGALRAVEGGSPVVEVCREPRSLRDENRRWAMDYMSDALHDGRQVRVLTMVETCTR